MPTNDEPRIRVASGGPSPSRFTVTDTYELLTAEDARAAFPGEHIYVMTDKGIRLARLVRRMVADE